MLVWEFSDMLDISTEDSYQISQILDHHFSDEKFEYFDDYFSLTTEVL